MVGSVQYHNPSVFRHRAKWELPSAISQVRKRSALVQIKPARKKPLTSKTWFLLDFMLWEIKCCRPPYHTTCILLQVCPTYNLLFYQHFPRAGTSVFVFWKQGCFCREIYQQTSPLNSIFYSIHWWQSYCTSAPSDMQMISFCSHWKVKFKRACFVLVLPLPKWTGLVLANPKALFPLSQDKICILLSS